MVLPTSSVLVDRVLAKSAANAINAIQIKSHSARNNVIEAENYQHIGREHGWYQGVERRKRLFTFTTYMYKCSYSFVQSIWRKIFMLMLMLLKDVFMIYALICTHIQMLFWPCVIVCSTASQGVSDLPGNMQFSTSTLRQGEEQVIYQLENCTGSNLTI